MRRIFPDAAEVEPEAAYADAQRARRHHRPWVLVNMIESVDGATARDGRSGALGGPADRAVFGALRSLADMILVGAGTVRAEHYGPPKKAGQRIGVVTRSAELDWSWPLFTTGTGFVVTSEDAPVVPVPSVRAGTGAVDLAGALAQLDAEVVLCEGGPALNGDLAAAGCLDELCVTIAPSLAGGRSTKLAGTVDLDVGLRLVEVLEADGYLFCRYLTS